MPPPLAADLRAARQWRSQRPNARRASPDYRPWYALATALHTDPADPWPVMDIVRYLKTEHPQAKTALAKATPNALHKALCRHLRPRK